MDSKLIEGKITGTCGESTIKLNVVGEVRAKVTPDVVAALFWEMHSDDQAMFFNCLALFSEGRMPFQLQAVTNEDHLSHEGRYIMQLIGDYSDPSTRSDSK